MFCYQCAGYESEDQVRGYCHRYPPDNGITRVKATWWCGEFKAELDKTIEPLKSDIVKEIG
jgi:hypothetical protein